MMAAEDPLQSPEHEHAEECRHRPPEFHVADLADRVELLGLDQAERIDDHDSRKDSLRQQPEQWRENQHCRHRGRRGDEGRFLAPPADGANDGRL